MRNKKFIKLIRALTAQERRAFSNYLEKNHGQEKVVMDTFDHIMQAAPTFEDPLILDINAAYSEIFGKSLSEDQKEKEKDRKNLLNKLNRLTRFLKEFLVREEINEIPHVGEFIWLHSLRNLILRSVFLQEWKGFNKKLATDITIGTWNSLRAVVLNHELYFSPYSKPPANLEMLKRADTNLDEFFVTLKLQYYCELLNRKIILEQDSKIEFFDEVHLYCEENREDLAVLPRAYFLVYQNLVDKKDEDYDLLYELVVHYIDQWSSLDQLNLLLHVINISIQKIRQGRDEYQGRIFQLYVHLLKNKIYKREKIITIPSFLNIVEIASRLRKFTWAQDFIKDWQYALPQEERNDVVKIALGTLSFEQGDFEKTLELLATVRLNDLSHKLRVRGLQIRSLYETNSQIDLQSQIINFRKAINRISFAGEEIRQAHFRFLIMLKELIADRPDWARLAEELEKPGHIVYKHWLSEKIKRKK